MPDERLSLYEVKRIAIEFARKEWSGEVTEFQSILRSSIGESIVEVQGRVKRHEQVPEPEKYIDTIVECPFKLQISDRDRKIIGFWIKPPEPPPPSSQPEVILCESVEPSWARDPRDRFRIDPDRFRMHAEFPIDDMRDRQVDRDLKKAKAHYWEERAKREKRGRTSL
jgi:hypothetical protein